MRFMQIESVLQTINRSEPAKNRFSVALVPTRGSTVQVGNEAINTNDRFFFSHTSAKKMLCYYSLLCSEGMEMAAAERQNKTFQKCQIILVPKCSS